MNPATFDDRPPPPEAPVHEHSARGPIVTAVELAIIIGVIVVDQVSKLVVKRLLPLHESRSIIPSLLDFTRVQNTGAAFGLLNAADFPWNRL